MWWLPAHVSMCFLSVKYIVCCSLLISYLYSNYCVLFVFHSVWKCFFEVEVSYEGNNNLLSFKHTFSNIFTYIPTELLNLKTVNFFVFENTRSAFCKRLVCSPLSYDLLWWSGTSTVQQKSQIFGSMSPRRGKYKPGTRTHSHVVSQQASIILTSFRCSVQKSLNKVWKSKLNLH